MPVIVTKSPAKSGPKVSCTCGRCEKCITRERVHRWRRTQKFIKAQELESLSSFESIHEEEKSD